jgi:hypothetical protein
VFRKRTGTVWASSDFVDNRQAGQTCPPPFDQLGAGKPLVVGEVYGGRSHDRNIGIAAPSIMGLSDSTDPSHQGEIFTVRSKHNDLARLRDHAAERGDVDLMGD